MGVRLVVRSRWSDDPKAEATYEFDLSKIVIGRGAGADVRLPHRAVSALHATIKVHKTGYALVDEGATNGTRVNGTQVAPGRPKALRTGDTIDVGGFTLVFDEGIAVAKGTDIHETGALARLLVRDALGEAELGSARLVVMNGPQSGDVHELPPPPFRLILGREESADIQLVDGDVSREHAELSDDGGGVRLSDLGSKNGVLVNDRKPTSRPLRDRDELTLGATVLLYEDPAAEAVSALEAEADLSTELPPMREPEPEPEPEPDPESGSDASPDAESKDESGGPADEKDGDRETSTAKKKRKERDPDSRTPASADAVIYLIAAAVLVLSVIGLVLLAKAS